ncbi:MAG: hypothetical protein H6830_00145 [Planctomycetes bacterium]|nr:hypothetical protein [Planctomycetota bacterium]MCB9910744.1 hypothetical protein [Planctomycetota bacterium]MCB9912770.1 hypothetical protein [Planctomycetota bacterium]HPF14301.1 hypothetical protein [Planctomycetota bacterium]HRV80762.1 hypothetical protein [Planctomycetota bacterium]
MAKRTYKRRSAEEQIEEYRNQIQALESRLQEKERRDMPVVKEIPRVKKRLAQFAQLCVDHGRNDLSNTTLVFLATLERQAKNVLQER